MGLQFSFFHSFCVLGNRQRINHSLDVSCHKALQVVCGVTYTVVGYAPLRVVVGTYLGRAVARRHQTFSTTSNVVHIFLVFAVVYKGTKSR